MPVTRQEFESVFPYLVQDLAKHVQETGLPQANVDWFEQVIDLDGEPQCSRLALTILDLDLQYSRWEIQPWNVRCGYSVDFDWKILTCGSIWGHSDSRMADGAPPSFFSGIRRHHGLVSYTPWPAMLVSQARSGHGRYQLRLPTRIIHLLHSQVTFPLASGLRWLHRVVSRDLFPDGDRPALRSPNSSRRPRRP